LQLRDQAAQLALKLGDASRRALFLFEGAPAQGIGRAALFVKAVATLAALAVGARHALGLGLEAARARETVGA
jgi:hypothetical protein